MHRWILVAALTGLVGLAGCVDNDNDGNEADAEMVPFLGYEVPQPDFDLQLIEVDHFLPGRDDVTIHVRVVRPVVDEPVPVIAQFTPYTAPGQNTIIDSAVEPAVGNNNGRFDVEFARRGYAFAYADVRGTGDSSGCLDLRGQADIDDLWHLTEYLGTQEWSNGNVGFIGASYPGSEAHMAAIAGNEHLKAVIPVVASTSFYHYHHNDGVPYMGQHSLGGTNTGYTQNAIMATLNPQSPNYLPRYMEEAGCDYQENMLDHGGLDQSGAYYEWWQERNLRTRAANITVPVLMAQGLADWNVKPDHIATWFNDLPGAAVGAPKTLIAGQWGHQYPEDADDAYGPWWEYAAAFFDTFLKEEETGMFTTDVAWVQDTGGAWHRSASWPIVDAPRTPFVFHKGGLASLDPAAADAQQFTACPHHQGTYGAGFGFIRREMPCDEEPIHHVTFTSEPFAEDTLISGVPTVELYVTTPDVERVHLVVVMDVVDASGEVIRGRENYGYLNPVFRHGLDAPEAIPDETYPVTIDFYPQEDLIKKGERLRFTIKSNDDGRTIEDYDATTVTVHLGDALYPSMADLPLRPAHLHGVRLG